MRSAWECGCLKLWSAVCCLLFLTTASLNHSAVFVPLRLSQCRGGRRHWRRNTHSCVRWRIFHTSASSDQRNKLISQWFCICSKCVLPEICNNDKNIRKCLRITFWYSLGKISLLCTFRVSLLSLKTRMALQCIFTTEYKLFCKQAN